MAIPDKMQHPLVALDLMRGLAALTVLVSHVRGDSFVEYGALPNHQHNLIFALFFAATRLAYEAVMVFFVLSGFLVGGQVLANIRQSKFKISDYAINRATRILIPLIPACLFTAAIDLFVFGQPPHAGQLAANMVGLNEIITSTMETNSVLWSLAYEIWFYILAGALGYVITQRPNAVSVLVAVTCIIVFAIVKTRYLAFWMLGAGVSLFVDIRYKKTGLLIGMCLVMVGSLFYQLAADSRSVSSVAYIPPLMAEFLMCIGVAVALPFLASSSVSRSLERIGPLATAMAGFSYTLYLTHRPTDALLGNIFGHAEVLSVQTMLYFSFRILICLGVAVCFYFCFERNTPIARKYLRKVTEDAEKEPLAGKTAL